MRNIHHERQIRNIKEPRHARKPVKNPVKKPAKPWTLDIPAIRLAVGLLKLGGAAGGAGYLSLPTPPLAVAASKAGWYQFTATPGAAGNAVIVGHVDTYVGVGVFYNLYQLHRGDAIYVTAGGSRQRFDVTSAREMPKTGFPVSQVFGSTEKHMLWLITCGGAFDYRTRHYLDNIVVSATWQPAHGKRPSTARKSHLKTL